MAEFISSRTPEGSPNRCSICGGVLKVEPSPTTLDAPCPHCGNLLWFAATVQTSREKATIGRKETIRMVLKILQLRFGPITTEEREAITRIVTERGTDHVVNRVLTCTSLQKVLRDP